MAECKKLVFSPRYCRIDPRCPHFPAFHVLREHNGQRTMLLAQLVFLAALCFADARMTVRSRYAFSAYREERILRTSKVVGLYWNVTMVQCLASCVETSVCRSFNFGQEECQLLGTYLCARFSNKLTASPGFSYFDLMENDLYEEEGPLWKSPYCRENGFCARRCESVVPMKRLNTNCRKDLDCQLLSGQLSFCRNGVCKCKDGYWIKNTTICEKLPSSKFIRLNTKYFHLSSDRLQFQEAENACEAEGSMLAKIEDEETQRFLQKLMKKSSVTTVWIGLSDGNQEGEWEWRDGKSLNHPQFWAEKEPNNLFRAEHCVEVSKDIGYLWNDAKCEFLKHYVCQFRGEN